MALAHPGFVQKVMGKVMPQSWAVRRDKVTQKSQTQRSQALNERPDSALHPPLPVSAVKRRRAARRKGVLPTGGCAGTTPWLGLLGLTVTPDVAQAMNLASDQQGVLSPGRP